MSSESTIHVPVMLDEVLSWIEPQAGQRIVDGTAGAGGHLRALAQRVGPSGWVLGIDRDPAAIERLQAALAGMPVQLACGSYCELPTFLKETDATQVDAVLLDLGLSSDQLADESRGFSFHIDGPLDLRFNPQSGEPAWRLLERLRVEPLADLIYQWGEERYSRRIARKIVERRQHDPVRTSRQLADLVVGCVPRNPREKIHPATRTFQALRIAVNQELEQLVRLLGKLPAIVKPGGRVVVISFHSLEDRLVKEAFQDSALWERLTRKPLRPSEAEVLANPRSRSAKLRAARRTDRTV